MTQPTASEALLSLAAEFERCAAGTITLGGSGHAIGAWKQAARMARERASALPGAASAPQSVAEDTGELATALGPPDETGPVL
jgi:hypothetical protein